MDDDTKRRLISSRYIWQTTLTTHVGDPKSSIEIEAHHLRELKLNIIPRHILRTLPQVPEVEEVASQELLCPCDSAVWRRVKGTVIKAASKVTLHIRLHAGNSEGRLITFYVAGPKWLASHLLMTGDAISSLL